MQNRTDTQNPAAQTSEELTSEQQISEEQTSEEQRQASILASQPFGWLVRVQGIVQGVGFRPTVYRLATAMQLPGDVCNFGNRVEIRLYCLQKQASEFCQELLRHKPQRAHIAEIKLDILHDYQASEFTIRKSEAAANLTGSGVIADLAPCPDCLAELFDPQSRRYGHPFINCTQCGPRYTLLKKLPYDRANTSMADFALCSGCDQEYHDPANRRFHAQPNACPDCGPHIWLETNAAGNPPENAAEKTEQHSAPAAEVIDQALAVIQSGGILALKGVGGFHLVCDATNADAIARLRKRKQRPSKPLAIMLANPASANRWVQLTRTGLGCLSHSSAPIVLQNVTTGIRQEYPDVCRQLAPGLNALGVMLPQSPLHWLLFHAAAGRPEGLTWLQQPQQSAWVMTSANLSGQPLITANKQAKEDLADVADAWLMHDRDIINRCDDSVVDARDDLLSGQQGAIIPPLTNRIGRGLAPLNITLSNLPDSADNPDIPSILACGGYLKNTLALNIGRSVFLSQHIGDLNNAANARQQKQTAAQLSQLLQAEPDLIACDLHPEGSARLLAEQLTEQLPVQRPEQRPEQHGAENNAEQLMEVPHHIAHIAAVMAEQPEKAKTESTNSDAEKPVLGLALDGFGLGWDGEARGGELILLSPPDFMHLGSFSALPLPGGDKAAREPWRMTVSLLYAYGEEGQAEQWLKQHKAIDAAQGQMVLQQLEKNINCPLTTSAGRWFDAIAGLLGISDIQSYEGEAAMRLEALAGRATKTTNPKGLERLCRSEIVKGKRRLSLRLLAQHIINACLTPSAANTDANDSSCLAWLFHQQLAQGLCEWVVDVARDYNLNAVMLSGGCAQNALLRTLLRNELNKHSVRLILPHKAPANDGGLALGQLAWTLYSRPQAEAGTVSAPAAATEQ